MGRGIYERTAKTLEARFWRRVEKSGYCWPWSGAKESFGYGVIWGGKDQDTNLSTHRVSWELNFGPIPSGLCVLHKCDNPPCCNPSHLFLGTRADNNQDRDAKRRAVYTSHRGSIENYRRGERHGMAVLTIHQAREIRVATGATYREIGAMYGVSGTTVRDIKIGKTWPEKYAALQVSEAK